MGLVRQALIAAGDDVDGAVTWLHDNEEARAEYAAASSCLLVHDRLPAPPPPTHTYPFHTHIPHSVPSVLSGYSVNTFLSANSIVAPNPLTLPPPPGPFSSVALFEVAHTMYRVEIARHSMISPPFSFLFTSLPGLHRMAKNKRSGRETSQGQIAVAKSLQQAAMVQVSEWGGASPHFVSLRSTIALAVRLASTKQNLVLWLKASMRLLA